MSGSQFFKLIEDDEKMIEVSKAKKVTTCMNNTVYSVGQNRYLLSFFQTLHVSIKPITIRCLFIQKLKTEGKNRSFLSPDPASYGKCIKYEI
jgi:hypothetical protein